MEWLDRIHRGSKHGEALGDVFDLQPAAEEIFEPAE
jgi:hypothetical protein